MAWSKTTYGQVTQQIEGNGTQEVVELFRTAIEQEREAQQEERKAQGKEFKTNCYVTDAGSCSRKVWLTLRNVPETNPLTLQSLINFKVGHAVEEAFAGVMDILGGEMIREVRVEIPAGDTVVSGRVDFLLDVPQFNALVELKSTSSMSMKFTLEGLKKGEKQDTHEKYLRQINLYLHASQQGLLSVGGGQPSKAALGSEEEPPHSEGGELIPLPSSTDERGESPDGGQVTEGRPHLLTYDHGYLVYLIKDAKKGQEPIQAFRVDYDREKAEADLKSLATIDAMAKRGIDPGIPFEYQQKAKTSKARIFPCSYCSYSDHCWGGR